VIDWTIVISVTVGVAVGTLTIVIAVRALDVLARWRRRRGDR